MDDRRLGHMAWMAASFLLFLIVLSLFFGCSTKKVVTETITHHDTLVVVRCDTLRMEVVKTKTDTLREVVVREVTLMKDTVTGKTDTIRIVNSRDHVRIVYVGDSTNAYKVTVDSILKAIDKSHDKDTVVKKSGKMWWEVPAVAVFFLIVVALLVYFDKKK